MKKDYHNRLLLMHPIPLQQLCGQCVNSHATALLIEPCHISGTFFSSLPYIRYFFVNFAIYQVLFFNLTIYQVLFFSTLPILIHFEFITLAYPPFTPALFLIRSIRQIRLFAASLFFLLPHLTTTQQIMIFQDIDQTNVHR